MVGAPSRSDLKASRFSTGNLLLDTLSPKTLERLRPHLERVSMNLGTVVAASRIPIPYVVFPIDCVVSTIARMAAGDAVEVGFTGRGGMVGAWLALHQASTGHESVVQLTGSAWRMSTDLFERELGSNDALNDVLLHFTQYCIVAAGYFTACNGLHQIEERYARWLLMVHDRVAGDEFHLTQEYAGQMLGVRRTSVTLVAGALSRAGLISYRRGDLKILDRAALEDTACECYAAVDDELGRLMGYNLRKPIHAEPSAAARHGDGRQSRS
jgi:CRP-like cAMP-binding protein